MSWRGARFAVIYSLVWILLGLTADGALAGTARAETFSSRVVATGFGNPWEIAWGPDGYLWVTEQDTGRVSRVRPSDGSTTTLLDISEVFQTDPGAQDGLLGMALDPDWSHAGRSPRVYVAYSYDADPNKETVDDRVKIRSYTYRSEGQRLTDPVDVITGIPAGNDHNSGRLRFGPDGKLYYTIGERGANQYKNVCKPIRSQDLPTAEQVRARDWQTYQGKILRLNRDGSIPTDNPVIGGVRSHIYSYGHRNAQGIAFGPGKRLYSVEHGPKTDDELNLIQPGGNYGWPQSYTQMLWMGLRAKAAYLSGF